MKQPEPKMPMAKGAAKGAKVGMKKDMMGMKGKKMAPGKMKKGM